MAQNGLKHILNMYLKSVTKTDLLTPPSIVPNVTLFLEGFTYANIQFIPTIELKVMQSAEAEIKSVHLRQQLCEDPNITYCETF